jgi:hypothetical protein
VQAREFFASPEKNEEESSGFQQYEVLLLRLDLDDSND